MRNFRLILWWFATLAVVFFAAEAGAATPTVSYITPSLKFAGDAGFTMTVTGTNFTKSSQVNLVSSSNTYAPTTTYSSSTTLSATIPASYMAAAASYAVTVGTSNAVTFTVAACSPPSNIPSSITVTCQCDAFARSSLNPSTIYSSNWIVSASDSTGVSPYINSTTGYLRLTENTSNNAKVATVPGTFPASGNYISIEFNQFAYGTGSSGGDGLAVVLSDSALPPVAGAYGGSLGYAQKNAASCSLSGNYCPGFNGGWVGVGFDEYGNYETSNEGRSGGLSTSLVPGSIGVRGSGSGNGSTQYPWISGTPNGGLTIATTSTGPGYSYQLIVDARQSSSSHTYLTLNQDTSGTMTSSNYATVNGNLNQLDVFSNANQAAVPVNWKISLTSGTGSSTNIHEIGAVRICAQSFSAPPNQGTLTAFNAIDSYYSTAINTVNNNNGSQAIIDQYAVLGHIYTKLASTPFTVLVAAINSAGTGVNTSYTTYSSKYPVTVQLIDDSSGTTSCNASQSACTSCTPTKTVITSQTMTFSSSDNGGPKATPASFTVSNAYSKVLVRMVDLYHGYYGCSADWFAIRPAAISLTNSTATNPSTTGTPTFKAGTGSFTLKATATDGTNTLVNYNGYPLISVSVPSGWTVGALSPTAFTQASSGVASTSFTYGEAGYFYLYGYNPSYDTTTQRGVYDNTWSSIDNNNGDCVIGSYSNTMSNGMYGCNFGLTSTSTSTSTTPPYSTSNGVGRFTPDHFSATGVLTTRADMTSFASTTGSIASGSSALTVASASGISAGNVLRIVGAGASGTSLVSVVSSISGTAVTLSSTASTAVSGATVYNLSSPSTTQDAFTYMGEPMLLVSTVTARNASEGITTNYADSTGVSKLAASTLTSNSNWMNVGCSSGTQCFGIGAVNGTATALSSRLATVTSVSAPVNAWISGVGTFVNYLTLARGTYVDGPYDALNLGVAPQDADNITLPAASSSSIYLVNLDANLDGTPERRLVATTKARYGRLRILNAYSSELLPALVPVRTEYCASPGSGTCSYWLTNTADNLTTIPLNSIALSDTTNFCFLTNPRPASLSSSSCLSGGSPALTLSSGTGSYILYDKTSKPTYVDLGGNMGASTTDTSCNSTHPTSVAGNMPWLEYAWCSGGVDPNARIKFGSPKASYIYLRERF